MDTCLQSLVQMRPEPHGRQAGRAVGSDWPRPPCSNQTGASGTSLSLTCRVKFEGKGSRGPTLELRIRWEKSPPGPSMSIGSRCEPGPQPAWFSWSAVEQVCRACRSGVVSRKVPALPVWYLQSTPRDVATAEVGLHLAWCLNLPAPCLGGAWAYLLRSPIRKIASPSRRSTTPSKT